MDVSQVEDLLRPIPTVHLSSIAIGAVTHFFAAAPLVDRLYGVDVHDAVGARRGDGHRRRPAAEGSPVGVGVSLGVGVGNALNAPAWSAMLPTLVSKDDLPGSVALNSVMINGARVVGPIVAGDTVSVSIDGIGTLTNPVIDRD